MGDMDRLRHRTAPAFFAISSFGAVLALATGNWLSAGLLAMSALGLYPQVVSDD